MIHPDKVNDQDIADRRENFYQFYNDKPCSDSDLEGSNSHSGRKRDLKHLNKGFEDDSNSFDSADKMKEGRSKRTPKPNKFYDELYPPEEDKTRKPRTNDKSQISSNVVLLLPQTSKKGSPKSTKSKDYFLELDSDDDDYKKSLCKEYKNKEKGYESTNFLISKYINKIKYCFDKLKVLSAENYKKDIHLTPKDFKGLRGKTLSNGYTYLDFDSQTKQLKL